MKCVHLIIRLVSVWVAIQSAPKKYPKNFPQNAGKVKFGFFGDLSGFWRIFEGFLGPSLGQIWPKV